MGFFDAFKTEEEPEETEEKEEEEDTMEEETNYYVKVRYVLVEDSSVDEDGNETSGGEVGYVFVIDQLTKKQAELEYNKLITAVKNNDTFVEIERPEDPENEISADRMSINLSRIKDKIDFIEVSNDGNEGDDDE